MAWTIRVSDAALRSLQKMDRQVARRILDKLREIGQLEDPRTRGRALTGNLSGLWRYRVGDWRIICDIEDDALVVLVVDVAHRSQAYRKRKS